MTTMVDYGTHEQAMQDYFRDGEKRAMTLGNRGPARFTADGKLHPDIIAAYERCGFYVFEGILKPRELAELEAEYLDMFDRLPSKPGSKMDVHGRPALGVDLTRPVCYWGKPLSNPEGGTASLNGRAPIKMYEPTPASELPEQVVFTIMSPVQHSDAYLRMCGHPDLLGIAAAVNGDDFVPFQEGIIIKRPGEGKSFSWHQDGITHWDSPDWTQHSHGVNLMPQLYTSTAANGVWFVPGTQAAGRVDIPELVRRAGSERLSDAVPLICGPGDVALSNRQVLHGSFANTSPDIRVTLGFGFYPRRSVLGVTGHSGETNQLMNFDAEHVRKRAEMIGYAIDARRQHFSEETPFRYRPHAEAGETYSWDDAARVAVRDYSRLDMRI